jgi:hypothetical protein
MRQRRPGLLGCAARLFVAAAAAALVAGCAGHEDRVQTALDALDRAAPAEAVSALNAELGVAGSDGLPKQVASDEALLVLDRGSILQSMNDFRRSARDLGAADKAIEVLDLSSSAAGDVGKYLFSDAVGPYKAPSYEKLMINTMNLVNYLALGDLTGAKVEARRLAIMQKLVKEQGDDDAMLGVGSYLAGFAFEKAGARDEALAYYDDALRYAQYGSLRDPLRVLTQGASKSPGIDALVAGAGPLAPPEATGEAEVLVVFGFGRVPRKEPRRIPIGLALTLVSSDVAFDRAQANALAAKGLVTWINYPVLTPGRGGYAVPTLVVDGRAFPMEEGLDVEQQVREAWHKHEGAVIGAAITRMIARVVAGEAVQHTTEALAKDSGPLGLLLGLATSAGLSAADTPDTRSWTTLPARIAIARFRVPAGKHVLELGARGLAKRATVDLAPGGWACVAMTALR